MDTSSADTCHICLGHFEQRPVASLERCPHVFCLQCILRWSQTSNTCPVDRISFAVIHQRRCAGGVVQKKIKVRGRKKEADEDDDEEEEPGAADAVFCEECGRSDRRHRLLVCRYCDSGFHMDCLTPSLNSGPEGDWTCPDCAVSPHTEPPLCCADSSSVVVEEEEEEEISDGELTDLLAEVSEPATTGRLRLSTVNRPGGSTEPRHSARIQSRTSRDLDPRTPTSRHVPKYLLRASGPAVRRADDVEADHGDASVGESNTGKRRTTRS
ncbi:PHD and RING finger domain-containing protein 1-like isoform X1 [Scophthalmus maximus]|uniref:PHD and RING finger domain-containing protein 1-like isoform X1 n=1 Tax=Scophthalmus maximus TaxID=52904 RepID=UPI001FA8DEF8|nr:PHD and RING finger domain-containing protein 1-like isoform X1 [Scophthalmus maximus]